MSEITMDEISIQIEGNSDKAIESLTRLTEVLDKLTGVTGKSITGLNQTNEKIKKIANNANKAKASMDKNFGSMGKSVLGFVTKLTGVKLGFLDTTKSAADFISAYAGFNKVLGTSLENLDDAKRFVKDLTKAWYLDEQQVMQSMSRYYNMTSTMGFTEDSALRMSKNLTQLSYDLQALGTTGATITEVQNQLASALRGEAEGLAKFGVSLNQATLQSVLYEKGINRTVSSLTAAQKAEVIYYQIMRQTYSKHGYYAEQLSKKIIQPAMAAQMFQNQMKNLARAIGSIFIPIISAVMPYLIALTQLLTDLAQRIAGLFGFELGNWDTDMENISAGFGDIGESADKAGKKIKGMLGDFDELHVISFNDGGAGAGAGGSLGLDASEFEYSNKLLEVTNEQLERAKKIISAIKDYVVAIGVALAGFTVAKSVLNFLDKMEFLSSNTNIFKTALGIGLTLGGLYLTYQGVTKLLEGEINPQTILETALGMFGLTAGIMNIASGLGITLALGSAIAITAGISLIIAGITLQKQGIEEGDLGKQILGSLATGLGAGITIGFLTGNPVIGIVAGVVVALGSIIFDTASTGQLQTFIDEFVNKFTTGFNNIKQGFNDNIITPITDFVTTIAMNIYNNVIQPIIDFFTPIFNAISNIFKTIKDNVVSIVSNIITNIFKIIQKIGEIYIKIIEIFHGLWIGAKTYAIDPIVEKITSAAKFVYDKIISPIIKMFKDMWDKFYNNFVKPFIEAAKWIHETFWDLFGKFGQKVVDFIGGLIKGAINGIFWVIENSINFFIRMLNGAIDIINGIPGVNITTVAELSLPKLYADGGFPTKGDLFVANEAGAEWVGSMNGRTAVANQDQITTGVRQATYEGMKQAIAESDFGGTTVYNYLDSKEIANKMTRIKKSNANMYG